MFRTLTLVALITTTFAGCTGAGSPFTVEAPQWQAGYAFSYRIDGTYSFDARSDGDREHESGDIPPRAQVIEVLNTTLLADDPPAYLVAVGHGPAEQSERVRVGLGAIRKIDLAYLPLSFSLDQQCIGGPCIVALKDLRHGPAPDGAFLDFPLTRGKTWGGIAFDLNDGAGPEFGEGLELLTTARSIGRRSIETPLGRVTAVQVEITTVPVNLDEFLKKVRSEARAEGIRLDSLSLDFSVRTRAWYSPDHQTVVKSETVSASSARASGRQRDGDRFDFAFDGTFRHHQVLTGAKLVPRAERDTAYIARLLTGKSPILDPSGTTPVSVDYALDLVSDKTRVNAAANPTVNFTTKLLGAQSLPAGHKASWRIVNPEGNQTAAGDGLQFSHAFNEPGEHTIEVEARNERGNVTASDGLTVVADYIKTLRVDCPDVGVRQTFGECPPERVPVRVGIRSLKVSATVQSGLPLAPPLMSRELRLLDPDGAVVGRDTEPNGGTYVIQINNYHERTVDGRDHTLQLRRERALLEDATYTIEALYGAQDSQGPPLPSPPSGASPEQWLRQRLGIPAA